MSGLRVCAAGRTKTLKHLWLAALRIVRIRRARCGTGFPERSKGSLPADVTAFLTALLATEALAAGVFRGLRPRRFRAIEPADQSGQCDKTHGMNLYQLIAIVAFRACRRLKRARCSGYRVRRSLECSSPARAGTALFFRLKNDVSHQIARRRALQAEREITGIPEQRHGEDLEPVNVGDAILPLG